MRRKLRYKTPAATRGIRIKNACLGGLGGAAESGAGEDSPRIRRRPLKRPRRPLAVIRP
jgi:hypothetical protein